MPFDLAGLERRVAALEAAQNASLRFGRVTSVAGGKCRVRLGDGGDVNSYELSTLQKARSERSGHRDAGCGRARGCLFSGQGRVGQAEKMFLSLMAEFRQTREKVRHVRVIGRKFFPLCGIMRQIRAVADQGRFSANGGEAIP